MYSLLYYYALSITPVRVVFVPSFHETANLSDLSGSLNYFKIFALDRFDLLDDELTGYNNICYFAITNDGSGLFLGHKSYSKYQRQLRITYWDNKIYSRVKNNSTEWSEWVTIT